MIDIDAEAVDRVADILVTGVLKSGTLAIAAQTRGLEKDLEGLTRSNVKGKLWAAWGSRSYPKGGRPAYDPVGEIFLNGRKRTTGAITYWTQPGVNKAKGGYWLAIPTDHAGAPGRLRNITPGEWERASGIRLQFVYQGPGKPALLMAEFAVFKSGVAVGIGRKNRQANYVSRDGTRASKVMVPIFTLIPFQRFANKFSINPTILRREKMLVEDVVQRMQRLSDVRV
ncbi:MAG: DUF6441 family protein [Sphingobium sp.]|nr:DUF6441 family protein [Sphingobium sp.]